jgi:hypothetical protein
VILTLVIAVSVRRRDGPRLSGVAVGITTGILVDLHRQHAAVSWHLGELN